MLFQASVRENLRYGRLDATDEEIEAAAEAMQAHAFIRQLPDGYDTPVGPRGARLSGGQRQRLALARALLKARDAPVVVLDEATSALDPETEAAVLRSLRTELAGRTILLVAHRLSAVRWADRVAVLADGRVAEIGTQGALLAHGGRFRQFYGQQADAEGDGRDGRGRERSGQPARERSLTAGSRLLHPVTP